MSSSQWYRRPENTLEMGCASSQSDPIIIAIWGQLLDVMVAFLTPLQSLIFFIFHAGPLPTWHPGFP